MPGDRVGLETTACVLDRDVADQLLVRHLADGHDDLVGFQRGQIVLVKRGTETFLLVENPGTALEFEAGHGTVAHDAPGSPTVADLDVLRQRGFDFLLVGRHLVPRFEGNHLDTPGTEAQGCPGHVHRDVAAANHQDAALDRRLLRGSRFAEKLDAVQHALLVFALDAEFATLVRAGGDHDRVVLLAQRLKSDVLPDAAIINELDAPAANQFDLVIQHFLRQPVFGNAPAKHAARRALRLIHGHRKTRVRQIRRRGQARGTGSDDRHLFGVLRGLFFFGQSQLARGEHRALLIGGKPFQQPDGDGLVGSAARADRFARMRADPAANGGKRVALADQIHRLEIFLLLDELDVALNVDPGRALHLARRVTLLENAEDVRRRLRVKFGNALAGAETTVEFIRHVHGADLRALAATGAFVLVHIPREPFHLRFEMTRRALQVRQLRQRQDFDIQVAGAFDEFGGDNAGRAITGRKSLVQMSHHAADGPIALDEIDLEPAVGEVQGGLHAGDAAALHKHCANHFVVGLTHEGLLSPFPERGKPAPSVSRNRVRPGQHPDKARSVA